MRTAKWVVLVLSVSIMTALGAAGVSADARINAWSHFGGDALYCNHDLGCYALNMSGNTLWSVPEATIVKAVSAACATNSGVAIAAGQGTYGPMTLWIGCPNSITLVGFDEWGKQATMNFTTDYLPVNPANDPHQSSHSRPECAFDLSQDGGFDSEDGVHSGTGFDVYAVTDNLFIDFLHWTASDPHLPECPEA